jgi:uncharacterized membrane protein YgcG
MQEQGMQVYGMIFKRVWRSMKEEFKKRYQLNRKFLELSQKFGPGGDFIRAEDYNGNPDQIVPVANPRMSSIAMRMQQAIIVKQTAMATPGYDVPEVERQFLRSLEVENIDRIYPGPDKVPPLPNPRMAVEQVKLQGRQMEIEAQKQEWANKLMEERRMNNAKIANLEASAMKAMAEAQAIGPGQEMQRIELQLKSFDAMIQAHKDYGDMINERIKALQGGMGGEQQQQSPNQGGIRSGNGQSGGQGAQGVSVSVPPGSDVSVGQGTVQ